MLYNCLFVSSVLRNSWNKLQSIFTWLSCYYLSMVKCLREIWATHWCLNKAYSPHIALNPPCPSIFSVFREECELRRSGTAVNSQSPSWCWLWPRSIKHWLRAVAVQQSDPWDKNIVGWLTCMSHSAHCGRRVAWLACDMRPLLQPRSRC